MNAFAFTFMIIYSILDIGRKDTVPVYDNHYLKWLIFITNWTMLISFIQSWMAVIIVTKKSIKEEHEHGLFFV